MADNNNTNGANASEENKEKKGFKDKAKDAWTWLTTNPVTKTVGKILLVAGAIGAGAFIGGVGVGIKEERLRAKSEKADEGETTILPVEEEAPVEETEEADEAPEDAPVEEQAEE